MHCLKNLRRISIFLSILMILTTGCAPSRRVDGGGTIIGNPELPAFDHQKPATETENNPNPTVAGKKESNQKSSMFKSFGFAPDPNNPFALHFFWKSAADDCEVTYKSKPTGDIQDHGIMIESLSESE
jgi:hypothetical protein